MPVGSLNADSAITVCDTFGRRLSRSKSGIRIAGIGRGEGRADEQCDRERQREHRHRDERHDDRRDRNAREDEQPETDGGSRDDAERDPDAAVKEDQGDAEREDELRAEPFDRVLDDVGTGRPEEDAGDEQHDHQRAARSRTAIGIDDDPASRISPTSRRTSWASITCSRSVNPRKRIHAARIPAFGGADP